MATLDENTGREPQVREQMAMMDKRLEALHGTIEKIEAALHYVLRPSQPLDETAKEVNTLVPLAAELYNSSVSIGQADAKLGEIIQRLEL